MNRHDQENTNHDQKSLLLYFFLIPSFLPNVLPNEYDYFLYVTGLVRTTNREIAKPALHQVS